MYVCMYIYIYIHMYMCVCIYIYIYIHSRRYDYGELRHFCDDPAVTKSQYKIIATSKFINHSSF